ncbi:MAG: hypothetical protein L0Y55_15800, partial [Anaerolineales bacterium]|nr:hypothetical protein [Anaerolineales bacterium]
MNNSKNLGTQVIDFDAPLAPFLYWDASFVVNALYEKGKWHSACSAFMARLDQSAAISYVSTLALDEIWFVLLQLYIAADYPEKPFWRIVNDNR